MIFSFELFYFRIDFKSQSLKYSRSHFWDWNPQYEYLPAAAGRNLGFAPRPSTCENLTYLKLKTNHRGINSNEALKLIIKEYLFFYI